MNKKSGNNPAWFFLGFPGIPMMVYFIFWVLDGAVGDAVFGVPFLISIIATIASLPLWNLNRSLAVGALIGGLIGMGIPVVFFIALMSRCC